MDLLKKSGIMVPEYQVAHSPEEAFKIAQDFGKVFLLTLCPLYLSF